MYRSHEQILFIFIFKVEMKVAGCIFLFAVLFLTQAAWTPNHQITGDASKQIADGIKTQILSNLSKLANQQTASSLQADLNNDDDTKRTLNSIDTASVNQIFSIFGLKDPGCDKNNDGSVNGDELKCLSKIWKNFVPK